MPNGAEEPAGAAVRASIVATKGRNGPGAKGRRNVEVAQDRTMEPTPAPVPRANGAKPAGETRDRWSWVEPSVWTRRMLTALDAGVKGGV